MASEVAIRLLLFLLPFGPQQVAPTLASSCINSQYVENHDEEFCTSGCSLLCRLNQRCQAFTTADGPCQLFVFDKCSKSVRECGCTRRGRVFVRQQPGLEPGALCPSGYGDDLCGVKYKADNGSWTWQQGREKCESEIGLVIMADMIDATEMSHIWMLCKLYNSGGSSWLGGFQTPGSPEPDGGWLWVACNITVNAGLWWSSQPDNFWGSQDATRNWYGRPGIDDDFSSQSEALMCECVSPFE